MAITIATFSATLWRHCTSTDIVPAPEIITTSTSVSQGVFGSSEHICKQATKFQYAPIFQFPIFTVVSPLCAVMRVPRFVVVPS